MMSQHCGVKLGHRVDILYVVNPHLIWMKRCGSNNRPVQIGLLGLFPASSCVNDTYTYNKWSAETIAYIKDEINGEKEIYFYPVENYYRHSLFEDEPTIFGRLSLKQSNGNISVLNKRLIDNNMARYCMDTFKQFKISPDFMVYTDKNTIDDINSTVYGNSEDIRFNKSIILNDGVSIPQCVSDKEILEGKEHFSHFMNDRISKEIDEQNISQLKQIRSQKLKVYDELFDLSRMPPSLRSQNIPHYNRSMPLPVFVESPKPKEPLKLAIYPEGYNFVANMQRNAKKYTLNQKKYSNRNQNHTEKNSYQSTNMKKTYIDHVDSSHNVRKTEEVYNSNNMNRQQNTASEGQKISTNIEKTYIDHVNSSDNIKKTEDVYVNNTIHQQNTASESRKNNSENDCNSSQVNSSMLRRLQRFIESQKIAPSPPKHDTADHNNVDDDIFVFKQESESAQKCIKPEFNNSSAHLKTSPIASGESTQSKLNVNDFINKRKQGIESAQKCVKSEFNNSVTNTKTSSIASSESTQSKLDVNDFTYNRKQGIESARKCIEPEFKDSVMHSNTSSIASGKSTQPTKFSGNSSMFTSSDDAEDPDLENSDNDDDRTNILCSPLLFGTFKNKRGGHSVISPLAAAKLMFDKSPSAKNAVDPSLNEDEDNLFKNVEECQTIFPKAAAELMFNEDPSINIEPVNTIDPSSIEDEEYLFENIQKMITPLAATELISDEVPSKNIEPIDTVDRSLNEDEDNLFKNVEESQTIFPKAVAELMFNEDPSINIEPVNTIDPSSIEDEEYLFENIRKMITPLAATELISDEVPSKNTEPNDTVDRSLNEDEGNLSISSMPVDNISFVSSFNKSKNNAVGLIENIITPKLLLHAKYLFSKTDRWLSMQSTAFPEDIRRNLKFKAPMSLQTAVWPAVMRGHNVFAVGPAKSGKTNGILVPLCSSLLNHEAFETLPSTHGPLALIICPNNRSAIKIESYCQSLLDKTNNAKNEPHKILRIDNNQSDLNNTMEMFNGCDILITTPAILKYTTYKYSGLDLNRLAFLLFDDCDVLDQNFTNEVNTIYQMCRDSEKKRANEDVEIKLFMLSTNWCSLVESLLPSVKNGVVCISAFQECVVYSKIKLNLHFVPNSDKKSNVIDYLNNRTDKTCRTVIVCDNDDDVDDLMRDVDKDVYHVIVAKNTTKLDENNTVRNEWKTFNFWSRGLILICCDYNLTYLDVTDAHNLIHYSLPNMFTAFGSRFSTLADVYPKIWNNFVDVDDHKARVDIYVDENNFVQLPKIADYVQRCGIEFNEEVKLTIKTIVDLKEHKKAAKSVELCDELLSFGKCSKYLNCSERHSVFSECDDLQDWIPKNGSIKFKILYVHNAACYSVRLFEHTSLDGKVTHIQQPYLNLAYKMATYFLDKNNQQPLTDVKTGIVCAVQLKTNQFQRCRILSVHSEPRINTISVVAILIDENRKIQSDSTNLYELPDDFKNLNNYVLYVRLSGIMPKDKDTIWPSNKNSALRKILSTDERNTFMRGRIVLGLGDTLWLESTQVCKLIQSSKRVVVIATVKNELIKKEIAIDNPNHLSLLYELCKNSIQLPDYTPKPEVIKPELVNLEYDQLYKVSFSSGMSPSTYFLRLVENEEKLAILSANINNYISSYNKDKKKNKLNIGDYCLALFNDEEYCRTRIDKINIDEATSDVVSYTCFYVDYGEVVDVKSEFVYPITNSLIKQLPFQALECKLFGIEPISGADWTEKCKDAFCDYCYESEDDDFSKTMCVKLMTTEVSEYTKGNKFSVIMYDCSIVDIVSVMNHFFVLNDFAVYTQDQREILDKNDGSLVRNQLQKNTTNANEQMDLDLDDESSDDSSKAAGVPNFDHLNIVDFDVSGSDSDSVDGKWDVCFDEDSYLETKKKLTPNAEPCIFDIFMAKENRMNLNNRLKEIPDNFNENDLDRMFEDASK